MATCLVTGSDEAFGHLLIDCVTSLRHAGYQGDMAVLDYGLSEAQKQALRPLDVICQPGTMPASLQDITFAGEKGAWVLLAKPFLPELFPGYETYVFVDADVWAQDDRAVTALIAQAEDADLVAISQRSRFHDGDSARGNGVEFNAFGQALRANWYTMFANKSKLPKADKRLLAASPIINAGIFSAAAGSPLWQHWQTELRHCAAALPVRRRTGADQLGLGLAIYRHNLTVRLLPEICNWLTHFRYDRDQHLFTETEPFYEPVSLMHLAGIPHLVPEKEVVFEDGTRGVLDLSYQAWQARRQGA